MPNQKNRERNRELVIEHITYDSTHRSTTTPYNTSIPRSQNSNEQASSRTPEQQPDIIDHILTQRAQKAAPRQEKIVSKANSSGRYLQLYSSIANYHQLRRKEKISDVMMEKLNRSSSRENDHGAEENGTHSIRFEETNLRTAIREGKMERVVPPSTQEKKERLAPEYAQRPSSAPAQHTNTSPPFPKPRIAKEKGSSKLAAYVEERKGKLNFHSPFEHIHFPTSFSRKSSTSSSTSSFACIGEGEQQPNSPIQALQTSHYENKRRLSGEGSSPWYNIPSAISSCKLCKKKAPVGIRSLCSRCEKNFLHPQPMSGAGLELSFPEEGIKSTPRLKDKKTLSKRKSQTSSPPIQQREQARLVTANPSRKAVLHTSVSRILSTRGEIVEFDSTSYSDSDSEEEIVQKVRSEYKCPEVLFAEWAATYGSGEYRGEREREMEMRDEKDSRDSGFYGFWDEMF